MARFASPGRANWERSSAAPRAAAPAASVPAPGAAGAAAQRQLAGTPAAAPPRGFQRLVEAFTALPCASQVLGAVSRFNLGPVTELLDRAAYAPLRFSAPFLPGQPISTTAQSERLTSRQTLSGPSGQSTPGTTRAEIGFTFRVIGADHVGQPDEPSTLPLPFDPRRSQRFEWSQVEVRFGSGGPTGLSSATADVRLYGTGRTFPQADGSLRWACALEILDGTGSFAGLQGTAVAEGRLRNAGTPSGRLDGSLLMRWMDPQGGLLATAPIPNPGPPPAINSPTTTLLAFMGEVDEAHPVQLRFAPDARILGSNVYERLRPATLEFGRTANGLLKSYGRPGAVSGSVAARLSFNPLRCCSIGPIQTRRGAFQFHDARGTSLGTLEANMVEGRSFRTSLRGVLLPVFRFVGFGPISGGSGHFAGATGMMTMSSVISVQPRTLSNLYLLHLDDPDGRWRPPTAVAAAPGGPR